MTCWNQFNDGYNIHEETSEAHKLRSKLIDRIDRWRSDNRVKLSNLSIYYTWKNIKKSYRNSGCKISGTTWNELPHKSCFISDIQDHFVYIIKNMKHWLISHRSKYMSTKFRNELHSKLNLGTIFHFWHPPIWNYSGLLKKNKDEWWGCTTSRKYWADFSSL